jgi:phosphate transport system substrate-binding protein
VKRIVPLALLAAVALSACGSSSKSSTATTASTVAGGGPPVTGNPSAATTLNESGSSLMYPYLQELVSPLTAAYANITLSPSAGGSGKGISDAASGTSQLGGSDAYLSAGVMAEYPDLLNIPIAVSAQGIYYNLPGVSGLKLSGSVLAQIYEGKITKWNDTGIASLNPGVSLPATTIVPVHRSESSGDTFIFTSFLSKTDSTWAAGPAFNTTVTWPTVTGELTAQGNPGMVQTCKTTPGCVAYVGVSAASKAQAAGLNEAQLENAAGQFLTPNAASVGAAVAASTGNVPANLAASLIYASGAQSYPIVNFEYIIVKADQSSSDTALAIRTFLAWAISTAGGNSAQYLSKENFVALPTSVVPKVNAAIAKIT